MTLLQYDSKQWHEPAATGSLGLRMRVRMHRRRLDRALADGAGAGGGARSAPELSLRSRQLAEPRNTRVLARSLRRVVANAENPGATWLSSQAPVAHTTVAASRQALLGLAEQLEDSAPSGPCGIARVLLLLCDGASPLYNPGSERTLTEAIWWVADGLQPGGAA